MMSDFVIETENLTKKYEEQFCVEQLCLHVPRGKVYALLGRNGAGKTTTMKMLMNLVTPTSGNIKFFNEDYQKSLIETYRRIGALIESPCFYGNLTARENLEIIARLRGYHNFEIVENALRVVNLEKENKKVFGKYSLGMRQRLGIAAAIIHEPEILILDEPMNGLDPIGIHNMRNYLVGLCKERNTTILLSSHILSEIEQIADVVGVMDHGKLLEEKSMDTLKQQLRKYIEYEVMNAEQVCPLLKAELNIPDITVEKNNLIRIYGSSINRTEEINRYLMQNNISIIQIRVKEESLEDYFSYLIGDDKIA